MSVLVKKCAVSLYSRRYAISKYCASTSTPMLSDTPRSQRQDLLSLFPIKTGRGTASTINKAVHADETFCQFERVWCGMFSR